MARVLVIDDEEPIRMVLSTVLESNGHEAFESGDGREALDMIRREDFDLVLCDMRMTPLDGIQVLKQALGIKPHLKVIMLTAFASVQTAQEAMKLGAFNYLTKPWKLDELLLNIGRALTGETCAPAKPGDTGQDAAPFTSWDNRPWKHAAEEAARSDAPTLIYCVGTNPIAIARSIHDRSSRKDEPFAVLPCATLPEPILAVEMHGCVRGAVEAVQDGSAGVFESAGTGTVLLDEISWMPHKLQEEFLEIAAEGSVKRIGGLEEIPFAARILATTNQDPGKLLAQHAIIPALHAFFADHILRISDGA